MMFMDKPAYTIDRGEKVEDACVRRYDERVRMLKDRGSTPFDIMLSEDIYSSKISENVGLKRRNLKTGRRITAASIGLPFVRANS